MENVKLRRFQVNSQEFDLGILESGESVSSTIDAQGDDDNKKLSRNFVVVPFFVVVWCVADALV